MILILWLELSFINIKKLQASVPTVNTIDYSVDYNNNEVVLKRIGLIPMPLEVEG